MYGFLQATMDESRSYHDPPKHPMCFKIENSDDPCDYWNNTFELRTIYSGDSFVVEYKSQLYSVMNSFGRIVLSTVKRNEHSGSGNFPHYDVINELGIFNDISTALEYIDDDMREYFYDIIPKALSNIHPSHFTEKRFTSGNKLQIQMSLYDSNWYKFEIKTNLKLWNNQDAVGLMMLDCEIEEYIHRPEGISLIVYVYKLGRSYKKRFTYPHIPKRDTSDCDVSECNITPDRGCKLCPTHLKAFDDGYTLPTMVRGDEGHDVVAYVYKFINCEKCKLKINAHVEGNWIDGVTPICPECKEKAQICKTDGCSNKILLDVSVDKEFCNDCTLKHMKEDYESK